MADRRLDRLAASHGILTRYISELEEPTDIPDEAKRALLEALRIDPDGGTKGDFASQQHEATGCCSLPERLAGRRVWGVTCQLYSLRSRRNLGIGDFEDLARLAKIAAEAGAAFLGVSPLHALFLADPGRNSPYSPSTRRFLNPLYIAIDRLDGGEAAVGALRAERGGALPDPDCDLVDYGAVAALKVPLLRRLFDATDGARDDDFEAFRAQSGDELRSFALFEAISAHEVAADGHAGWQGWPKDLHDRQDDAVARFEAGHEHDIRFHEWLQYVADRQLGEAQRRAIAAGMAIGLYLDFAVGVHPDGAETWANPDLTVRAARVGSPPDLHNSEGQDWGLAPLSPEALAACAYAPLARAFDAVMRHAGAVRIDHAMGLARLWWIPVSGKAAGGGYVRYPLGAMIDTVAHASSARSCLVIGEDLGTVPKGFRTAMEKANILSYRVLWFQRDKNGRVIPPARYPNLALACISTHDLATLAGWWSGSDIALRAEAGRQDAAASRRDRGARGADRRALLAALDAEDLLPPQYAGALADNGDLPDRLDESLAIAVHRFGARARSLLFAVQIEDMLLSARQANLPGTVDEYPNWRLRLEVTLEDLAADRRFRAIAGAMSAERPEVS